MSIRMISDHLPRYRGGRMSGLGSNAEDAGAAVDSFSGASDVGAGGWWSGILDLGKTYLQTEAQKKTAQTLANTYVQPGSQISANGVVKTTASVPVQENQIMSYLKNPMVLGGLALGAFLLLRKKR